MFTLIDDFPVRPILCGNNLSALPSDFQYHVVRRYRDMAVSLLDANSGFEPRTFGLRKVRAHQQGAVAVCIGRPGRPSPRRTGVENAGTRVQSPKKKRVYVLIGNEPVRECMERIGTVLKLGGEPHVQPLMKLNTLEKRPWVHERMGWTEQHLKDVAWWTNRRIWQYASFDEYVRQVRTHRSRPA